MQFKPAFPSLIALSLTIILSLSALSTAAEDGTSGSLPPSLHQCEVVEAQWASPSATPVASPMASPAASPMATPVADADALTNDLMIATHSILDCMSDNNAEVLIQITGEPFRASWLGLGTSISDANFEALLPMMPKLPYELIAIDDVSADGDSATAIVKFTTGRQVMTSEWNYTLVEIDGKNVWQVQQENYLPTEIPADAMTMQLTIDDGSYSFAEDTVESGEIVIRIQNVGANPHEVLIVRAPDGSTAADFAAAPSGIPDGGTFIGQITVPAGSEGNIVLTDVRAGTYTIVDLLPDSTGIPNVSNGMYIEFTVD